MWLLPVLVTGVAVVHAIPPTPLMHLAIHTPHHFQAADGQPFVIGPPGTSVTSTSSYNYWWPFPPGGVFTTPTSPTSSPTSSPPTSESAIHNETDSIASTTEEASSVSTDPILSDADTSTDSIIRLTALPPVTTTSSPTESKAPFKIIYLTPVFVLLGAIFGASLAAWLYGRWNRRRVSSFASHAYSHPYEHHGKEELEWMVEEKEGGPPLGLYGTPSRHGSTYSPSPSTAEWVRRKVSAHRRTLTTPRDASFESLALSSDDDAASYSHVRNKSIRRTLAERLDVESQSSTLRRSKPSASRHGRQDSDSFIDVKMPQRTYSPAASPEKNWNTVRASQELKVLGRVLDFRKDTRGSDQKETPIRRLRDYGGSPVHKSSKVTSISSISSIAGSAVSRELASLPTDSRSPTKGSLDSLASAPPVSLLKTRSDAKATPSKASSARAKGSPISSRIPTTTYPARHARAPSANPHGQVLSPAPNQLMSPPLAEKLLFSSPNPASPSMVCLSDDEPKWVRDDSFGVGRAPRRSVATRVTGTPKRPAKYRTSPSNTTTPAKSRIARPVQPTSIVRRLAESRSEREAALNRVDDIIHSSYSNRDLADVPQSPTMFGATLGEAGPSMGGLSTTRLGGSGFPDSPVMFGGVLPGGIEQRLQLLRRREGEM